MRVRRLWYHEAKRRQPPGTHETLAAAVCDAEGTVATLSQKPQPALGWFSRWIAFLTTPFKFVGISGWKDTGCSAKAEGQLAYDAAHSTDGFWTIDACLSLFAIGEATGKVGCYVRIEVEPGTAAHDACAARRVRKGDTLRCGGPVVIDTDGPFLEIHPDRDFSVLT
jgi:hypothetical protein